MSSYPTLPLRLTPGRLARNLPMLLRLTFAIALAVAAGACPAEELDINPDHPERYVVQPGDTLWGISSRFLNSPWQWPELWRENQQIENPHYIYPGDVLVFRAEAGGIARLTVETPSEIRLSPSVRNTPVASAIPAIPLRTVGPFLTRPQVVSLEDFAASPYVVDFVDDHILAGPDDQVYVRAILGMASKAFTMLRGGRIYHDIDTQEVLGQEGVFVADCLLEETGDPATVKVTRAEKEVRIGDRLLPYHPEPLPVTFQPHAPRRMLRGHIVDVLDGVSQIGQYSIVAIDRGQVNGLEPGHVLAIKQQGKLIRDTVNPGFGHEVLGKEQQAGLLMVFRTFPRISFALVMSATRFIHPNDFVESP